MATDADRKAVVAVKACDTYDRVMVREAIEAQFQLLGGVGGFVQRGQRILIKPNLIVPKPPEIPAQTHPEVIYAMAEIVKDAGAVPVVANRLSTCRGLHTEAHSI